MQGHWSVSQPLLGWGQPIWTAHQWTKTHKNTHANTDIWRHSHNADNLQSPIRPHVHIWAEPQSMCRSSSSGFGCVGNVKDRLKSFPAPSLTTLSSSISKFGHQRWDAPRPPAPTELWCDGGPSGAAPGLSAPSSHPHSLSVPRKSIYELKENIFLKEEFRKHLRHFLNISWAPNHLGSQGGDLVVHFQNHCTDPKKAAAAALICSKDEMIRENVPDVTQ